MALRCPHCSGLSVLLVVACGAVTASAAAAPEVTVAGALRALTATGIDVLYSSDLVPEDLPAPATMRAQDALSRANEALAAYGLALRNVGDRRYVVTRSGARPAPGAHAAATQPKAVAEAPADLGEVSVFASRYVFDGHGLADTSQFSSSDLARAPGAAEDPLRALRAAPGTAANASARPYIRGAQAGDVLVEFDGIPVRDPFHLQTLQTLISGFDPAAVDKVDVYTGGFPVQYGTRAAGVIDVTPRSLDAGSEYRVGASRVSYDASTVGRTADSQVDWLATARRSSNSSLLRPVTATFGIPTFYDSTGRVRLRSGDASTFTAGWLILDDEIHVGGEPSEEISRVDYRDLNGWLAWDWVPSSTVWSRTSVSAMSANASRSGTVHVDGLSDGHLDDHRRVSGVELRTSWMYVPSAALLLAAGAELGGESATLDFQRDERYTSVATATFGNSVNPTASNHLTPRSATQALYTSVRWQRSVVEIEAGTRLDRQQYTGLGVHAQLSPRVNVRIDPRPAWHLYGSWGQFTQAQRVGDWRSEENQQTPDPATRAEHLIGGVASEASDDFHWRVEAYRNRWSSISPYFDNTLNSLSLVPELQPDRIRIAPTSAEASGVEFSASRSLASNLDASGSYSVARTSDDVLGQTVPRTWDQPRTASLGLTWHQSQTTASLLSTWHSGWPRTPLSMVPGTASAPAYFVVGDRNSARWGDYFTADLRVAQVVALPYGELSLWLDATNITNRSNTCCSTFAPADEGATLARIGTQTWLPRLINVGFSYRVRRLP